MLGGPGENPSRAETYVSLSKAICAFELILSCRLKNINPSSPLSLCICLSSLSTRPLSSAGKHASVCFYSQEEENIPKNPKLSCCKHISLLYLSSRPPRKHYLDSQSPTSLLQFSPDAHIRVLFSPPSSQTVGAKVTSGLCAVTSNDQFSVIILLNPSPLPL